MEITLNKPHFYGDSTKRPPTGAKETPPDAQVLLSEDQLILSRQIDDHIRQRKKPGLADVLAMTLPSGVTGKDVVEVLFLAEAKARRHYQSEISRYQDRQESWGKYKAISFMDRWLWRRMGEKVPTRPGRVPELQKHREKDAYLTESQLIRQGGFSPYQDQDVQTILQALAGLGWEEHHFAHTRYFIPAEAFSQVADCLARDVHSLL